MANFVRNVGTSAANTAQTVSPRVDDINVNWSR